MPDIHPTASVATTALVGEGSVIGPFSVVREGAVVGPNTWISSHVIVESNVTMGGENRIGAGSVIGGCAQDRKGGGEEGTLVVGEGNVFGEYVTLHCGTAGGGGVTRIGNEGIFETFCHIGHDCFIDDRVHLGPLTAVAGHVDIHEGAETGSHVGVHQFVRLGEWSRCEDFVGINQDLPPFCACQGNPPDRLTFRDEMSVSHGWTEEDLKRLREVVRRTTQPGHLEEVLADVEPWGETTPSIRLIVAFLREGDHRYPDKRRGFLKRITVL